MKEFKHGLLTGLTLQLAIGPVFFFIVNLALQRTFFDGLAGAAGVALGDYFYITLSILGIGRLLEHEKTKKVFGIISSVALMVFGAYIIKGILGSDVLNSTQVVTTNILGSFSSVFLLTISSPLTIVLFTSLFTTKAIEHNYTQRKLWLFGLGAGSATFLFMSSAVVLFSLIRGVIPVLLIKVLNFVVGMLLLGYGSMRLMKSIKADK